MRRGPAPKPAAEASRQWQNRIVGEGEEDPTQLLANPQNWRIHSWQQQKALGAVLDEVGWVQRCIVNKRTGHVVDGHLRVALAISKGEKVPVVYIDVSEDEERLIVATIDPLSAMAGTDEEMLAALLGGVETKDEALDQMLQALMGDAQNAALKDEPADNESRRESNERDLGDRKAQVKPVIYVDEIAVFERALRATGEVNRGKALITVCNAYLQNAKGQFDIPTEGYAPLESLVRT